MLMEMPQKRIKREEALALLLFFYIFGFVLIGMGYWWGIFLVGLAFYLTFVASPTVREVTKTVVKGIVRGIESLLLYRRATPSPTVSYPAPSVTEAVERPRMVEEIISRAKSFKPYRRPNSEKDIEDMLMQYLKTFYPSLRTQLQYERTQIDGQIEGIGIEIKYEPDEAQLDRLFGQIEKYLRHLDYVIAVIGYERSDESTEQFRKRLSRSNWDKQVAVVSIP
jgi:hypothetical protein